MREGKLEVNIMEKSNVDLLAEALFDGDIVAEDFKVMPGSHPDLSAEEAAKVLYESMQRMGIISNGHIVKID